MKRALLVVGIIVLGCISYARAQPPKSHPRREDVKFIRCDVCNYLAANAFDKAEQLTKSSKKKPSEDAYIELIEKVTTAWRKEGEWITFLHLDKSLTGKLAVSNKGKVGECGEACKTIERAAEGVMGEHDTDVAEALYVNKFKSKKAFTKWLCNELSGACSTSAPSLPSGHKAYPPFKPMAPDGQNLDRIMGEMADSGLKGKMYSREDLMEKYMGELGMDADGHDPADFARQMGGGGPGGSGPGGLGKDEL